MCDDLVAAVPFSVDLWSDVVCPFCDLGSPRLAQSHELCEHRDDVVLKHHAFELDPLSPTVFNKPLEELVTEKYAMPVKKVRERHHRLESRVEELCVAWSFA